jgi:hypothetical protein
MKSILHQLAKYKNQPDEESTKLIVPEWGSGDEIDIEALAKQIASSDSQVPDLIKKLGNMPRFKRMDILYPTITLARYHLYYNHGTITSEAHTDTEIIQFVKNVDKAKYREEFTKSCDEDVIRATLIRCLIATFDGFKSLRDRLPKSLRPQLCSKLGVSQSILLRETVRLQERLNTASFSIEQHILSRLGYIMIWNSMQDNDTEVLLIGRVVPNITDGNS